MAYTYCNNNSNTTTVEPLTTKLIEYLAKNNKLFDDTQFNTLPDSLKDDIEKKRNEIFIHNAFSDLVKSKGRILRFYYKNARECDIIYLMYKIRDDPEYISKEGYINYSFTLNINNDTGDAGGGDSLYTLNIVDNKTGEAGVYETMVGRFD